MNAMQDKQKSIGDEWSVMGISAVHTEMLPPPHPAIIFVLLVSHEASITSSAMVVSDW